MDQDDHRAGGLLDDLFDQHQRVVGALAEPHQGHVWALPGGHGADVVHVDRTRDDLVAERCDDRRHQRKPVLPLVRNQDPEVFSLAVAH
jgi:hypothetical protein